jgi:YHS domain-containing protein
MLPLRVHLESPGSSVNDTFVDTVADGFNSQLQELPERKLRGVGPQSVQDANSCCEVIAMTTDPVCGMKVDESTAAASTQFAGKKYSFCSTECRDKFEKSPERYVENAA